MFREIALSLPGTEEKETWGDSTFRVRDKIFCVLGPEGVEGGVKASLETQAALVGSDPATFSPSHYTGRYGWTTIKLATVDADELRELIIDAWRQTASKKAVAAYDAQAH
jgi:hypothetical protein